MVSPVVPWPVLDGFIHVSRQEALSAEQLCSKFGITILVECFAQTHWGMGMRKKIGSYCYIGPEKERICCGMNEI